MKKTFKVFTLLCFIFSFMFIVGCNTPEKTEEKQDEYSDIKQLIDIYNLAVKQGYTGSYMEWLDSLKGEDGKDGVDGLTPYIGENGNWWIGDTDTKVKALGTDGQDGATGPQGETGEDGKSAYDLYCEAHPEYSGTFEEWIEALINGELITNKHIVTFDSNGGSEVENQEVLHGFKATKPEEPIRLGYTFDGWYIDGETWSFIGYSITEDITLTAKWTQNEYVLTLNNEGYETKEIIHYDDSFTLPELTKEGYAFLGWFDSNDIKYESGKYTYLNNLYLTAKFIKLHQVTFDTKGGNEIPKSEPNYVLYELPTPEKEGYIFYGWYYNSELVELPFSFDKDVTLEAKWVNVSEEFGYVPLDGNTAKIVLYNGTKTDVIIPEEIDGYTITEVTKDVFSNNKNITSLALPKTLRTIEDGLLEGCNNIERLQISDTISTTLFKIFNVKLTYKLPNSLDTIELSGDLTAFPNEFFKSVTTTFIFVLPETIEKVPNNYFRDVKSVNEIVLSENTTIIGDYAFFGTSNLEKINIHDNIVDLGKCSFTGCAIKNITIPEGIIVLKGDGVCGTFGGSKLETIKLPSTLETIEGFAFHGCSSLTSIVIPEGVTSIGSYAFWDCSSLTSVVISEGVTRIESSTFYNCSSLESIVIPEGVTRIESSTFYNCSSLESIVIPEGVTSIDPYAFSGCGSLTSIIIPEGVTTIGNQAFENCKNLTNVIIPSTVTSINDGAFNVSLLSGNVYYGGSSEDWNFISNDSPGMNTMESATIYFYSETEPTEAGNYWHYDSDGVTPVIW